MQEREVENIFGEDGTLEKQIITNIDRTETVITYHPNQEAREIERKVHEAQLETADEETREAEEKETEKVEETETIIPVKHE